jgi:hypothetical protein
MDEAGEYVPQPGNLVFFDRPPGGDARHRLLHVASHEVSTGLTTFDGLAESLSARQLAELGAMRVRVVAPGEVKANWVGAARRLAAEGAGDRSKIQQVYQPHVAVAGHVMRTADDQAALALARQLADDIGEPIILARVRSGELLIATQPAFPAVADAYEAETLLVIHPTSPSTSGWLTHGRSASASAANRRAMPSQPHSAPPSRSRLRPGKHLSTRSSIGSPRCCPSTKASRTCRYRRAGDTTRSCCQRLPRLWRGSILARARRPRRSREPHAPSSLPARRRTGLATLTTWRAS